jgi:hypothetical protein
MPAWPAGFIDRDYAIIRHCAQLHKQSRQAEYDRVTASLVWARTNGEIVRWDSKNIPPNLLIDLLIKLNAAVSG